MCRGRMRRTLGCGLLLLPTERILYPDHLKRFRVDLTSTALPDKPTVRTQMSRRPTLSDTLSGRQKDFPGRPLQTQRLWRRKEELYILNISIPVQCTSLLNKYSNKYKMKLKY